MGKNTSRRTSWATLNVLVVVGAVALLAAYLPVPANAAPVPSTAVTSAYGWAYGGNVSRTVTASGPNGSFAVHYFYGWKVIANLTNTSANTSQLEVQRWLVGVLFESGRTNGAALNLTVIGWQNETAFANLTSASAVTLGNGTQVTALGLVNDHAWGAGNITEVLNATWTTATGAQDKGYIYASLAAQANVQLSFAPALGLFPLAPSPGETWNSSSNFTASGEYQVGWHIDAQVPWGTYTDTGKGSPIAVQASGTAQLTGADLGNISLSNGESADVVVIAVGGNGFDFDHHEGLIFLPTAGDIYDSSNLSSSATTGTAATTNFGTDRIDVNHGRVVAALSTYSSSSVMGPSPTAATPATATLGPSTSVPVGTLQATPMTVPQAESWCLQNCPTTTHSTSGNALGGIILLGLIAVVAIVGVAAWSGRRRRPRSGIPVQSVPGLPPPGTVIGAPSGYGLPPPPPPPQAPGAKDPVGFYY